MARPALPLLLLLAAAVVFAVAAAQAYDGDTLELGSRRWLQYMAAEGPAEGPTAAADDLETPHISYGALSRNNVPCSIRGASYYNCREGAEANSYTRGCSAITLCRG